MARRRPPAFDEDAPKPKLTRENLRQALAIFEFIRPYQASLILGLILLFLSSLVFMVFPYAAGEMVDIAQGSSDFEFTLPQVGLMLLGVLVLQGLISYTRVILFARLSEYGIADVRRAVYGKLISLPIVFYEQSRVGELISRITADVERLYNAFSITLAEFIRQIIILIVGVGFLAWTAWQLAAIMLLTFPFVIIGAMVFGRYIRKMSKERQEQLADTNIILSETMQSISAVKAFTNELFEYLRYGRSLDKTVAISMRYARGRALFSVFIVTVLFGALFFIIWQGALMVQNGTMSAGDLVAFVAYTAIIGGAIAGLGNFYTELLGALGATERIREILDYESETRAYFNTSHSTQNNEPTESTTAPLTLQGAISYRDVEFAYPTRPDVEVLKGVSLDIAPGEKVALVGTSGSGKSTMVSLLLRFYELTGGSITVDGRDLTEYDITRFRENMAIVPQEVLLFGGTIRENISYGKPDATDAEIRAAAEQANAWEFIRDFPEGMETLVGERGIKLSGGQRQRIAIARAILKDPAILLLDEATSSLDAESERVVQEALDTLMQGRTSIIIAHRLATIRNVDRIYVLEDGRIVERGTHNELSMIEDGAYNALAKLQFASEFSEG